MDLRKDLYYWQVIDLPDGTTTPGKADHRSNPAYLNIDNPALLQGKRVLDVAANDGFWSFWAERQGAAEVLATDIESLQDYDWGYAGPPPNTPVGKRSDSVFHYLHELLGSKTQHRTMSVYKHDPQQIGEFDLVFCYGLIYHLRHPLLAIDALRRVCRGACIIESHVLLCAPDAPLMAFYEDSVLQGAASNWCGPTVSCMTHWMKSAGFDTIYTRRRFTGDRQIFVGVVDDQWRATFDACPNLQRCEDDHFKYAHATLKRALQPKTQLNVALSIAPEVAQNPPKTDPETIVGTFFDAILGRPADDRARAHFVSQLDRGLSTEALRLAILTSPEMKRRLVDSAGRHQFRERLANFCAELQADLARGENAESVSLSRHGSNFEYPMLETIKYSLVTGAKRLLPQKAKTALRDYRNNRKSRVSNAQASTLSHAIKEHLTLAQRVDQCPRYRHVMTNADVKAKPLCVCCEPQDVSAAAAFFNQSCGVVPKFWGIVQWRRDWLRGVRTSLKGYPLLPLDELANRNDLQPVLWVNAPRERTFCRILAEYGVHDLLFVNDPGYSSSLAPADFFEKNRDVLETVYAMLEDNESRETFASVLRHRRENDCGYLRIAPYPEYEHPLVYAKPGDTVVDAGGFDGRTSMRFAEQVGEKGCVFCFEPVQANLRLIEKNLEKLKGTPLENVVRPMAMGLAASRGSVSIGVAGGSSKVQGVGGIAVDNVEENETISVTDLSSLWADQGVSRMDLLSLDIEGLEMDALRGAEDLIRRFRPKLQISIYHKPEDLFEIPLWIRDLGLGYRFFMGHHDSHLVETDLYAIADMK